MGLRQVDVVPELTWAQVDAISTKLNEKAPLATGVYVTVTRQQLSMMGTVLGVAQTKEEVHAMLDETNVTALQVGRAISVTLTASMAAIEANHHAFVTKFTEVRGFPRIL